MAEVVLNIGGRGHTVACRDGEEAHLRGLATTLDRHFETAQRASGGQSGERTFLFLALILADALDEAQRTPGADRDNAALVRVADRLEEVAGALEESSASA